MAVLAAAPRCSGNRLRCGDSRPSPRILTTPQRQAFSPNHPGFIVRPFRRQEKGFGRGCASSFAAHPRESPASPSAPTKARRARSGLPCTLNSTGGMIARAHSSPVPEFTSDSTARPAPPAPAETREIQIGIVMGFFACLAYALLAFAPFGKLVTTTLAACFGPALAGASLGLRRVLDLDKPRASSRLGMLLNALGGALFSAMALVQLAVGYSAAGEKTASQVQAIWLGLDVAWDAYIGLGTLCFALAMLRHPRFGRAFAFFGLAISGAFLALNFYTFPTPPANAGLVDLGPGIGLWYLVVTIQMWRSLPWARHRAFALGVSPDSAHGAN